MADRWPRPTSRRSWWLRSGDGDFGASVESGHGGGGGGGGRGCDLGSVPGGGAVIGPVVAQASVGGGDGDLHRVVAGDHGRGALHGARPGDLLRMPGAGAVGGPEE